LSIATTTVVFVVYDDGYGSLGGEAVAEYGGGAVIGGGYEESIGGG
jgi:hypothetical protein